MRWLRWSILPALGTAALLAGLAACGPSDEEVDARIATAVAGVSAGTRVQPTATPFALPTPLPTATPFALPTPLPTATPFALPTPLPTATPFALPTPLPTATPFVLPTPLPTATPFVLPTPLPTATPFVLPTPLPTATPFVLPTPLPTATPFAAPPEDTLDAAAVYQQAAGSVVYIETPEGNGTGWVVAEGLIVTNEHVVNSESAVTVRHAFLPPFRAEVEFTDPVIDVAFITYNVETTTLDPLPRRLINGDALGETLLVLGYSSTGVQDDGSVGGAAIKRGVLSQIVSFGEQGGRRLRIDAAVDPGDSGGPVLDAQGQVVGMSKGVVETNETGRRIVGIFYAVHIEEIETLLAAFEAEATPG